MGTSFLTQWLSDHEIKAICWTLIHSLWIGMVIALFAGLLITFTRKSSADIRYRVLCGILVLFVAMIGVTYYFEIRTINVSPLTSNLANTTDHGETIIIRQTGAVSQPHIFNQTVGFLNQNMNIIFMVWLLFFMLKSLKMVSGLLYIQRIRNYKVHEVSEEFKHKIEMFSSKIGIRQSVSLMQSELVKVPAAIGWLKPLILLPMGIILQLSAEQLESILWHELAHIRRRDYLVNILQGVVETVFFFNPGLLWISSLIRAEREACCDDIVLSQTNRKANYLEALLAFGHEDYGKTALVMSIGSGNQLRDRLKRIVNQENKRLSIVEKIVLSAGLILLSAFTTLPKADKAVQYLSHIIAKKHAVAITPGPINVLPVANEFVSPSHPQQASEKVIIARKDTAIHFTSVLFKDSDADLANCDVSAMDEQGNEYHLIIVNNKLTAMEVNDVKVNDSELASHQYMVSNIEQTINQKRLIRDFDIADTKAHSPLAKFKKDKNPVNKQYDVRATEPDPRLMKDRAMRDRRHQDSSNYSANRMRAFNVIADLVNSNVVAKASDVKWFGLTETELIVNGQKQPDDLQQRLKTAYGIHKDYGLYYGPVEMTGTGVFIDVATPERMLQQRNLEQFRFKQKQLALQDMRLKMQQQQLWSPKKELSMQQHLYKLDTAQRRFFKPRIMLQPIISNVIDELVNDNVIKDKSDLSSFKLTNRFLMVNGAKQSEAIHEKLRAKYLSDPKYPINKAVVNDPDFGLHYDAKQGGMGIGISIDRDDP